MSFNISKRLNKIFSIPGNTLINGVLNVSSKIIIAINDIINTIKYEKKFEIPLFLDTFKFLAFILSLLYLVFFIFFSA